MLSELDLLYCSERRKDELHFAEQQRQRTASQVDAAASQLRRQRPVASLWDAVKRHMPKLALPAGLRHA